MSDSSLTIFGVRHHGPGSARALQTALHKLQPDIVLIEGPPDANDMLHWLVHPDMEPPIALLVYRPDKPERAGYYPFTVYSPELQATRYGFDHQLPVRFVDLPQANLLAQDNKVKFPDAQAFAHLAQAAGFPNYEMWWNQLVEQRQNDEGLFESVLELMSAMREETGGVAPQLDFENTGQILADRREAYMRSEIRRAQEEGHQRIAFVCGAWHAPALLVPDAYVYEDSRLLANMPTTEVETAWVPWTYGRIASHTGYGAGVSSPGWYSHIWEMHERHSDQSSANESITAKLPMSTDLSMRWLSRVATLLREEDLEASAAHVIEAVRLSEALAALRNRPYPGLTELNEAAQTVMCGGHTAPMQLIHTKLIVGERMGMVPPDTPMVPLQRDLYQQQRRLKLRPNPEASVLKLDLRNNIHLERSQLLHRLLLLNISWGQTIRARGVEGTYSEMWRLTWRPSLAVKIVEANVWGNTIADASAAFASDQAKNATDLSQLTELLDKVLLAELPDALLKIMQRIQEEAAISHDVVHMMKSLPPLARIMRYGSVRQIDQELIEQVVASLLTRICIGLPSTCRSMNIDAAEEMYQLILQVHGIAISMPDETQRHEWHELLKALVEQSGTHGLLAGQACRLQLDSGLIDSEQAAQELNRTLVSRAIRSLTILELQHMTAWVDGFLRGSDLLLIYDDRLWKLVDQWILQLESNQFHDILPLLRRTFADFSEAAKQQMQTRVRHANRAHTEEDEAFDRAAAFEFDTSQAEAVIPLLRQILGGAA